MHNNMFIDVISPYILPNDWFNYSLLTKYAYNKLKDKTLWFNKLKKVNKQLLSLEIYKEINCSNIEPINGYFKVVISDKHKIIITKYNKNKNKAIMYFNIENNIIIDKKAINLKYSYCWGRSIII